MNWISCGWRIVSLFGACSGWKNQCEKCPLRRTNQSVCSIATRRHFRFAQLTRHYYDRVRADAAGHFLFSETLYTTLLFCCASRPQCCQHHLQCAARDDDAKRIGVILGQVELFGVRLGESARNVNTIWTLPTALNGGNLKYSKDLGTMVFIFDTVYGGD